MRKFRKAVSADCANCGESFRVQYSSKQDICACPFCGEDVVGVSEEQDAPLYTFDDIDEIEEQTEEFLDGLDDDEY